VLLLLLLLRDRVAEAFSELPPEKQSKKALADYCGVKAPSVNAWFSGDTKSLKGENLVKAAEYLNVEPKWLAEGIGPKERQTASTDENTQPGPAMRAPVPLISWVQAGDWASVIDNFQPGDAEEWLPVPKKHGPRAFALRVRGVSMEPKYRDGSIIFVDPDRAADHGRNVVVRLDNEKEATFKQLVIEGSEKFLKPLNPDWPGPKLIPINGNATICGVVIGQFIPD